MFSVTKIAYIANFNFAKQKGSVKKKCKRKLSQKSKSKVDDDVGQ